MIKSKKSGVLDQEPLEIIISIAKETALLFMSLVLSVKPTIALISITTYLVSMKLVTIFVILYRLIHQNNNNYVFLFIAMYLYLAGARVDVITLLNYLKLLVLYNISLRKLRNITISSTAFIKKQVSNNKLVDMWDNFEYKENVVGKRIRDIVKFKSVTMVL